MLVLIQLQLPHCIFFNCSQVDLEIFNHEDVPALLEMNAVLTDHQEGEQKGTARPAICRPLADYVSMKA